MVALQGRSRHLPDQHYATEVFTCSARDGKIQFARGMILRYLHTYIYMGHTKPGAVDGRWERSETTLPELLLWGD